jgi:hypothetical protein
VKRKGTVVTAERPEGWTSLWGPVDDTASHGALGIGVVVDTASIRTFREDSVHQLVIAELKAPGTLTYYGGAGWTLSSDFAGVEEWNAYLSRLAKGLRYPLRVKFSD